MYHQLKKTFLFALVYVTGWVIAIQRADAQSLHDSLRHMLNHFEKQAKDENLKLNIREAQSLYLGSRINDSLSKKLCVIDSLLVNNWNELDKQLVQAYGETLVQVLQLLPPSKKHIDYVNSLNTLSQIYHRLGKYNKMIPLYEEVLLIRKTTLGEEDPKYIMKLHDLAFLYFLLNKYDKALPLFQKELVIIKKIHGEEHQDYAASLLNLANLYLGMGQYEKALAFSQQALAIRKKVFGEEHPACAESLNIMARIYWLMGQYEKALPLFQQSMTIRKKVFGEEHRSYAESLNNLALSYMEIGQYEKALPLFQQALIIRKKLPGEKQSYYALGLNNLASLYGYMKQYDKALPLLQEALTIYKQTLGEEHPDIAMSLNNMAWLYRNMGHYEKALPLSLQSLEIERKVYGEGHPSYARGLNNLATLYILMKRQDKAIPLLQEALAIFKQTLGAEHPEYSNSLNSLGFVYSISGNQSEAPSLLINAANITLKHLTRTYATLSEQEKMVFLSKNSHRFYFLPSLVFTHHIIEPFINWQLYQNEITLKGMVLEDQQQVLNAIRKSGDSATLQLYEQWQINKNLIGKQLLLPITKRLPYLDSLKEATTQQEQQLSRQATSFRNLQQNQAIMTQDIFQKLQNSEAAVEFIRFKLPNLKKADSIIYAALILLPKDSAVHFVPLFEEKQLQHLLKPSLSATTRFAQYAAINRLYVAETKGSSRNSPDSFYQLIWKPMEKYLNGIDKVYYAPTGLLHRLAFGALRSDISHLLIDKYQLIQVLSTRSVVLPVQLAQKPVSVALWGNINYNISAANKGGYQPIQSSEQTSDTTASSFNFYASDTRSSRGSQWNALPGTKKEIDTLQKLFSLKGIRITTDSGAIATEEVFKALSGQSPQVMHLATHGFFLPVKENNATAINDLSTGGKAFSVQQNPMFRSGLVLAGGNHAWKGSAALPGKEDGILTAYEIAQMDLSSTDLVVLSACETALGDLQGNEGVIGLQRAFKMAGVKQMIISLWRVPDKETTELMTIFYQNWLKGQSTREALRNAQLRMKEKYPPYYWAAFVLVE